MADTPDNSFNLKPVVDEKKNKIIFIESNADFVDVLLSFSTILLGNIM